MATESDGDNFDPAREQQFTARHVRRVWMIYRRPFLIATMFAEVVCLASVTLAATYQQQDQGVRLFAENCAACHGTFGEGGSGPDLTNIPWQSEVSDSDLDRIIGNGVLSLGVHFTRFFGFGSQPKPGRSVG